MQIRTILLALATILLIGCSGATTTTSEINESPHGTTVAGAAQLPVNDGPYRAVNQTVNYGAATGYLALPEGRSGAPGIVLIHEWWGLNDNIRATADKLATHGYRALAVDLYKGEVAPTSEEALNLVQSIDQEEALQNLEAAQTYLRSTGSQKVASFGFCFGGGQSMNLAVSEFAPDASIIYYGTPVTNTSTLQRVTQPVLGIFGSEDTTISLDDVEALDEGLDNTTEHTITVYDGANHAFANPSGDRFNEEAAAAAWNQTLSFLQANLEQ